MEGLTGKGEGFEHFPGHPWANVQGLGPCHEDHENIKDLGRGGGVEGAWIFSKGSRHLPLPDIQPAS